MALRIATNSPQRVRLLAVEPETAPSNFGADQFRWKTSSGDLYVSPAVGKIFAEAIAGQQIQSGEWVQISKSEAALGNGRKGIRWELRRLTAAAPVGPQADGSFAIPMPPAQPQAERMAPATAVEARPRWADALLAQTNALTDVYGAALAHASAKHGNAIKPDDVRSILLSVYIGLSKGNNSNHAAA
jgi:hypothetical protein